MARFSDVFEHLPQYKVIVCKICRYAVVKSSIQSHLSEKHKNQLTTDARKAIADEARSITQIADTHDEVVYPEPTTTPLAGLQMWDDGLKCTECGHIQRRVKHMQEHCREQHNWVNSRRRGRATRAVVAAAEERKMWTSGVHCQQFFKTQGWQKLFEVTVPQQEQREMAIRSADVGSDEEAERFVQSHIESVFSSTQEQLRQEDEEERAAVEADTDRHVPQTWLRRAGWARHLEGFDRRWLAAMSEIPAASEDDGSDSDSDGNDSSSSSEGGGEELARVCDAVQTVIWKAQRASKPDVVGFAACCYVNRRETGETSNERPLNASQQGKTVERYAEIWCRIVCYIWRTWGLRVWSGDKSRGGRAQVEDSDEEEEEREEDVREVPEGGVRDRRPPYKLTWKQQTAIDQISDEIANEAEEEQEEGEDEEKEDGEWSAGKVEAAVLRFLIAMLDHDVQDNEYTNGIVSGLAVLGLDEDCAWKGPSRATRSLSAIVTVSRMLVLYQAKSTRTSEIERLQRQHGSRAVALKKAPTAFELAQKMVHGFMTLTTYGGKPTPMNWVLMLRTYGLKVHYGTTADGVVDWVDDTLLYGHISFSMPDLRAMIHGLVHTTRVRLLRDLLLLNVNSEGVEVEIDDVGNERAMERPQLPQVKMEELMDNAAEMRVGWSFVEDGRNTEAFGGVNGKDWINSRIVRVPALREEFVDMPATMAARAAGQQGPRSVVWRAERIEQYRQRLEAHRRDLLVLMHMTGGQPARGTEITTTRFKNGTDGAGRGVFVEDGMMVYVVRYHKGVGFSGKEKVIHRYLPREVGELLMYDLWLVMPFWRNLERVLAMALGETVEEIKSRGHSAFLWEPKPEQAWKGPKVRSKRMRSRISGMRAQQQAQQARQPQQPRKQASLGLWDTDKVRKALQRASTTHMGVKVNIMCWRHGSKAIYRRYIADKTIMRAINEADGDVGEEVDGQRVDESNWQELGFHLQTGHGAQMGEGIYGRGVHESPFHTHAQRTMFGKVSKEWHRFLLFKSALDEPAEQGTAAAKRRHHAEQEELRRWMAIRKVNVQSRLEKLVGVGAQFRGFQQEAIEAVMQQKSPVVAIMATGGGKSLLFMLPAFCSTGVTVVVVPLIMLRQDMVSRCKKAGIECIEWNSARPHEWAQIMFVTPESAVSEAFGNFLNRQRAMGRLDRIVIDECHVVLDAGETGWRSRILALRELAGIETQMVYLTATMPPADEPEFRRLMGLAEGGGTKEEEVWFRARTSKRNVKYQVFWHDEKEEEEAIVRLVEEKRQQYGPGGQIIVYCDTVAKTKRYAKALGCQCFHRDVGDGREKERLLKALKEGTEQVWTATNALGLGIDAPAIRGVFHVGKVRKVRDYAQESGRAGRDGFACESIVLQGVRYDERTGAVVQQDRGRWGMEEEMQEFVDTESCRRIVLDRVLDGRMDRSACEEGEEACDNCVDRQAACQERQQAIEAERPSHEEQQQAIEAGQAEERSDGDDDGDTWVILTQDEPAQESAPTPATASIAPAPATATASIATAAQAPVPASVSMPASVSASVSMPASTRAPSHATTQPPVPIPSPEDEWVLHEEEAEAVESSRGEKRRRDEMEEEDADARRSEMEMEEQRWEHEKERLKRRRRARANKQSPQARLADGQRLGDVLEEWCVGCAYCHTFGDEAYKEHEWDDCMRMDQEKRAFLERFTKEMKREVKWAPFSGCWGCAMPQGICETWQRDETNGRFKWSEGRNVWRCQYRKGALMEAVAMVWMMAGDEMEGFLKARFDERRWGFIDGDLDGFLQVFVRWMGLKQVIGEYESNNACRALVEFGYRVSGG